MRFSVWFYVEIKEKVENDYHMPGSSHWLNDSYFNMIWDVEKEVKIIKRGRLWCLAKTQTKHVKMYRMDISVYGLTNEKKSVCRQVIKIILYPK